MLSGFMSCDGCDIPTLDNKISRTIVVVSNANAHASIGGGEHYRWHNIQVQLVHWSESRTSPHSGRSIRFVVLGTIFYVDLSQKILLTCVFVIINLTRSMDHFEVNISDKTTRNEIYEKQQVHHQGCQYTLQIYFATIIWQMSSENSKIR